MVNTVVYSEKSMHPKFLLNGTHGCISHLTEQKKIINQIAYKCQKPHQPNPTGSDKAYYPNKDKENVINKKYKG